MEMSTAKFVGFSLMITSIRFAISVLVFVLVFVLVHRFVNNCTNHVGYGVECAGLKTQA